MFLKKGYVLGNRYEIIDKIGAGGMSIVYKARCLHLQRTVAIKVLREEFLEDEEFINKFSKEAQAVASLSHPNIVNVYDVGKDGDVYYIVMEYLDGKDLGEIISKLGKVDENSALTIIYNIAEALNYAHKNNIVHRDLKSKNVIINDDGIVKVADFGIATATTSSTISVAINAIGSVHYFSPEQAKGEKVDERSDIYSLGIIAYELFTGKLPFDGETPVAVALKHVSDEMPKPSLSADVSENIDYLVLKSTSKKAEDRYQNASEMMRDIDNVLEGKDITQNISKNKDIVSNFSRILNDYNDAKKAEDEALIASIKSENMGKTLDKFNQINKKLDEDANQNTKKEHNNNIENDSHNHTSKRKGTINKILTNLGIYKDFDDDEFFDEDYQNEHYEDLKDEEENYLKNSEILKENIEIKQEDIDDLRILEPINNSENYDKTKRPGYISLDVDIPEDDDFYSDDERIETPASKAAMAAARFFDEFDKDDEDIKRENKEKKEKSKTINKKITNNEKELFKTNDNSYDNSNADYDNDNYDIMEKQKIKKKKKFSLLDFITLDYYDDDCEDGYDDGYDDEYDNEYDEAIEDFEEHDENGKNKLYLFINNIYSKLFNKHHNKTNYIKSDKHDKYNRLDEIYNSQSIEGDLEFDDFKGGNGMSSSNSGDGYISKEEDKKVVNAAILTSLIIIGFILIGMIKYMIYLNDNKLIKVPNFTGLMYEDVKDKWKEKGIKIEVVGEEVNLKIKSGGIVSQNVKEDSLINKNSVVEVILSKGKSASVMPDLQARSVDEAKAALEKYSVYITTVEIENEDIQKGYIVKTQPEYGAEIQEGMAVVLYLSLGNESEEEVTEHIVPSLLGMSEDEAKKALEKVGLELGTVKRQSGATKTNSKVIAQSENAGDELEKGTKINITVAKDAVVKEDDKVTPGNKDKDETSNPNDNTNDKTDDKTDDKTNENDENQTEKDNKQNGNNQGSVTTVAVVKIQPKFEINPDEIYLVQVVVESPNGETKMKYSQKHNGSVLPLSKSFNVEVGSTVSVYIDNELQSENYID